MLWNSSSSTRLPMSACGSPVRRSCFRRLRRAASRPSRGFVGFVLQLFPRLVDALEGLELLQVFLGALAVAPEIRCGALLLRVRRPRRLPATSKILLCLKDALARARETGDNVGDHAVKWLPRVVCCRNGLPEMAALNSGCRCPHATSGTRTIHKDDDPGCTVITLVRP